MKALCLALCLLVQSTSIVSAAETILVASQSEYRNAVEDLRPGDTIILKNGEWRDFEILFTGSGEADQPITLTAETKGEVILSGRSNLRLAGQHLVVSGLVFRDGHSPTNTVIAFRRIRGDLAYHSRITEVVIDHYNNPERYETDFWVMMYGKHNRFDHNHLIGKSNSGVTMAVRLDSEESQENYHRIDHNYFGPRPILGSNGGETLRIGTSHYSLTDSYTTVENNYFDRCNGELEIISNKSGNNTFRGNLFYESRGTLTLRHGNNSLVENNVFLGNGVDHTGGIRVINKRQTVRNNYMYGLTGHRFGGAFVVMNAVPNSPINRYHQVEDSVIENNSIIASAHVELGAGSDEERSAPPISTTFSNNLIHNEDGKQIIAVHDDVSGIAFSDNLLNNVEDKAIDGGFASHNIELEEAPNGLYYPASAEFADVGVSRDLEVLDRDSTGVGWYEKPDQTALFDTGETIVVAEGEPLSVAVNAADSGDIIALRGGRYLVDRTLIIEQPLTIKSYNDNEQPVIEFERTALFEIVDGGSLKLSNLNISGRSAPDMAGNSVIRTSRYSMLDNYTLIVEDSTISDLDINHSFNFLAPTKHTFANRIAIRNSIFRNITGHILAMDKEVEDLGIYNGEYIYIHNSEFENIEGALAIIYRGGTDESTFGPHFELSASKISNVGGGRRNKSEASVSLLGVQNSNIYDNRFNDSQPIRIVDTVGDPIVTVRDNEYVSTGAPVDSSPGFSTSLAAVKSKVDEYFAQTPDVPTPTDAGGGYTHEQHKRNGIAIHDAGALYQLTGEEKYATHAKQLLLAYADMYPGLGEHPARGGQSPGRLFWQSLNEAVWLVYAIQGYDAIIETLSEPEQEKIEQRLLRTMADFLSVESPQTFDRLHNHGTWAVAAVGMTGYVLNDEDYVNKALYGLSEDGESGFIKQMDVLFSPDGYYSEGPYYQRYALMPYVLFARSIEQNNPDLGIFKYRDSVLLKAIYACIDLSYAGLFFPINDAIKDKGLDTIELRYGIAIAYALTQDATLLSIAEQQKSYVLTPDGFELAQAIDKGMAKPYEYQSVFLRDGETGENGALAVLRDGSEPGHQALVFKASAQGMGHGHFDKLNWLYYDNGQEIITDYGAARFLNVVQKFGGRYLPENTTWAKQTIAHNTLVVDEESHFGAELSVAEQHHPTPVFFESTGQIEIVAATMDNAYDDVAYNRTMMLLNGVVPDRHIVVDVVNVDSRNNHQYDLPLHYNGQFIASSKEMQSETTELTTLGPQNGYQHLWLRAKTQAEPNEVFSFTWLNKDRFYTYSTLAADEMDVLFTELGANDPELNLRKQSALIFRTRGSGAHSYISVLEAHGEYNGSEEYTIQSDGSISVLERYNEDGSDIIRIGTKSGNELLIGLSYDPRPDESHSVTVDGRDFEWQGYYKLFDTTGVPK
ncbi:MAG: chondroitinase-B domain-containing protein [Pseudohongiellaceae bacterium]